MWVTAALQALKTGATFYCITTHRVVRNTKNARINLRAGN